MAGMMRVSRMEKERAMHIAKNCKDSKFGTTLLEDNVKENRLLDKQLEKLEKERRRLNFHVAQVKNMFLQERNNKRDPMVIVERPPSPDILRKIVMIENNIEDLEVPGYMKPLKTRIKTPSNLLTIDAFSVKTNRKANVWEDALKESQEPRFHSAVLPSFPLSMGELMELQRGWRLHARPKSQPAERARIRRINPPATAPHDDMNLDNNSNTFITQLPVPSSSHKTGTQQQPEGMVRSLTVHFEKPDQAKQAHKFELKKPSVDVATLLKRDPKVEREKNPMDHLKMSLRKWLKDTQGLL